MAKRDHAAVKVIVHEVKSIDSSILAAARKAASAPQQHLNAGDTLRGCSASGPSDESFLRHWHSTNIAAGSVQPASYKAALRATLVERVEANIREARAQLILDGTDKIKHIEDLLSRMKDSLYEAMDRAIDIAMSGEKAILVVPPLEIDGDIDSMLAGL